MLRLRELSVISSSPPGTILVRVRFAAKANLVDEIIWIFYDYSLLA